MLLQASEEAIAENLHKRHADAKMDTEVRASTDALGWDARSVPPGLGS